MTYTESLGGKTIDWANVLDNIPDKNSIEFNSIYRKALNWGLCPVGAQSVKLPRTCIGRPIDDMLTKFGSNFYMALANYEIEDAKVALENIEARAFYLIYDI